MAQESSNSIEPGCTYQHYTGGFYVVNSFCVNCDTDKTMVLYSSLQSRGLYPANTIWCRSLEAFQGNVLHNGVVKKRFRKAIFVEN